MIHLLRSHSLPFSFVRGVLEPRAGTCFLLICIVANVVLGVILHVRFVISMGMEFDPGFLPGKGYITICQWFN